MSEVINCSIAKSHLGGLRAPWEWIEGVVRRQKNGDYLE